MLQASEFTISLKDHAALLKAFNPPNTFEPNEKNKYGLEHKNSQNIFNEHCVRGLQKVAAIINRLQSIQADVLTVRMELETLLQKLGDIRQEIAEKTKSKNIELFGRLRNKNPLFIDKEIIDYTSINNSQHKEAHGNIKKLMSLYFEKILDKAELKGIAYDDKNSPNSRYIITFFRAVFEFEHKKTGEIVRLKYIEDNAEKISKLLAHPSYKVELTFDCPDESIGATLGRSFGSEGAPALKYLVVGEVQIKIKDNQYIKGTRHITYYNNTIGEFLANSQVILQHSTSENYEFFLDKIAALWHKAIFWKQEEGTEKFNEIMADIQFYLGQAMFFYRGSPTISKMFSKGTYYAHGFIQPASVSATDEHCLAEWFPYMKQFRKKFIECFPQDPTSMKSQQINYLHSNENNQENISDYDQGIPVQNNARSSLL